MCNREMKNRQVVCCPVHVALFISTDWLNVADQQGTNSEAVGGTGDREWERVKYENVGYRVRDSASESGNHHRILFCHNNSD